ncbi:TPA: TrlF family AAA-like ATPase [Elizabethkingia anophelis]|uniref:TrlF family AAA-like ATPase n=1 Tax=Elizabethkingia anophelis TaxID=1117645 RepID=UPI0021A88AB8|nr:hypothetical protein [Elizabethkingia anophelis]MDV3878086.1 hypothetical protein [Elizabethkingia anophelis]
MTINRGSEWRKWDLHIHSPKTHSTSNKYNSLSIQDFCNEIIKKGITVIGLTNYFYITENEYNEVVENLQDKCYVIPNFEFRASDKNSKGDHINFHVLFNPKLGIKNILNSIANVKLHNHSNKYCRIDDIKQLGIESVSVDFETLINQLQTDFKIIDDFIICTPYNGYGGFKVDGKPRNISQEKKFDEASNFILGNNNYQKYFLDKREYILGEKVFVNDKQKCVINCSDAHTFSDISNKFTWVKAQPTFEGLKQIIYEPIERVKIQTQIPEVEKQETLMIEKVTFHSSDNKFTPNPIYFNKNLNVIIGGKSSGKSILLYNIAKTLYKNINDSILKYKDADDDFKEKDLYNLSLDDSLFTFKVYNYLGNEQSIVRENNQRSILNSIKYIPQNHLSNLVDKSKKNSKILKEYIRDLIKEDPFSDKEYEDFIKKLRINDRSKEADIDQYFAFKNELILLDSKLQQKGDKETIKKTIDLLERKINENNKSMSEKQTEDFKILSKEYTTKQQLKNSLISDLGKIKSFLESTRIILNEINTKKNLLLENIELQDIRHEFNTKLGYLDIAITNNDNLINLLETNKDGTFKIIKENILFQKISNVDNELLELKTKLDPYNKLFENQVQIEGFQKTISDEKIKLSEIEQIEKEIKNIQNSAKERKKKIFIDIEDNRKLYDEIIEKFKTRIELIKQEDPELNIHGEVFFNFPKYRESVLNISHGNSKSYERYDILKEKRKALDTYDFGEYLKDLQDIFTSIENDTYSLLSRITKTEAIKIILKDYFFDHWDITYKNDTIHKMSTGKASLVLLKVMIKLSTIKGPILIDQPEDNLDNRSVTNELVEYLKEKKKERQIILVTHNANIVVNADAENIIIANQRGQSENDKNGSPYLFDYINGALEDTSKKDNDEKDLLKSMGIREHIAEIVEGGKEAFKKREEKYGF